tara:strand:- start:7003 stop:8358 length:1356 start_codon:yes stop_codon:yes gene_type:complete
MKTLMNLKVFFYLSFLVLPSYIIGIAVTEITLLFLIILFFIINKNFKYYKDPKILFLLLFSLLTAFSGLINLNYNDLKIPAFFHFRYVLITITIIYFIEELFKEKNSFNKKFLNFFLLIISFLVFDSIVQFFLGYNLFGQEIIDSRVSGIFGEESVLGSFLLYILPIIFLLILNFEYDIKKNHIYLLLFFSFYFIAIYISAGRTPFFLTILFLILMILFDKNFKKILIKCSTILFLFIVCEGYFQFGKTRPFHKLFIITFIQITDHYYHPRQMLDDNKTDQENSLKKKDDIKNLSSKNKLKEFFDNLKFFSDDHQNHYIIAVKLFKEKPIFGSGPKGFRNYCRNVKYDPPIGICSTHPHNFFFQILSELGLAGILFYLFSIFFLVYKAINSYLVKNENLKNSSFYICSISLLILIFPFLPSGNFFNNWISIVNYYYIGFYIYFYNQIYHQG